MEELIRGYNKSSLYNPEIKERFLLEYNGSDESRRTIYYSLKVAARSEKQQKKDLFEMTSDEIEEVFYTVKRTTEESVRAFISHIMSYINWATYAGYRNSNLPLFTGDSISSMAHKYVCKTFSDYYTQEQLMKVYAHLINKQDVMILQCMFEGIRGKGTTEIFNLKKQDLYKENGKYYANLYDTAKGEERLGHEISEYLYELMLDVDQLTKTYTVTNKQIELIHSNYILKKTGRGNKNDSAGEKLSASYLTNKSRFYKEMFNKVLGSENFKYSEIEKSGIMHYLYQIMKNKDNNIVSYDEYKMISDRFNIGKYIHDKYDEPIVNYSAIKDKIDIDFYEEYYGEIELI